jgi:S1-C subfamily serine protease
MRIQPPKKILSGFWNAFPDFPSISFEDYFTGGDMNFSKFRVVIPAAVFACLLAASLACAQNRSVILQSNSGDAFLGITMEDVTASNKSEYRLSEEKGAIVRSVQEGSPAEEAGLRENDVVLEFAGQPVWSIRQLSRLVSETPVGRNVAIIVSRDGNRVNLSATLGTRADRETGQRFGGAIQGDQLERFFEQFPNIPNITPRQPSRPDAQGGRQGAERSDQRPRLGVETQPLTEQMAGFLGVPDKKGVLITSVTGGSASDGKLKAGDVIIGVDNREVTSPADLTRFVREASGEITVKVVRDKKQVSVKISLASDETTGGGYRL